MKDLVSIITPTYNHENFIGDCIRSVLAQTYPNWEMIIIDDGSSDGTANVIAAYKDERIKYIKQENKGIERLSETYNFALSIAKGEFIAILEGDDYWPHNKLEVQLSNFTDSQVVLSFGRTQIVTPEGSFIGYIPQRDLPFEALYNDPIGRACFYMMNPHILTYTFPVSVVIRKKALECIGGFKQPVNLPLVDYPTFLQLALEGKFIFNNEILGFWRRHESSITKKNFYLILEGVRKYIEEFQSDNESRLPITTKEKERINWEWNRFNAMRCLILGRWLLVDSEWIRARQVFNKGLIMPGSPMLFGALKLGAIFSYLHLKMEFLFYLMRKPTIYQMLQDYGKDMIVSKEI